MLPIGTHDHLPVMVLWRATPRITRGISEDTWHSHLLSSVKQSAATTSFYVFVCRGWDSNTHPSAWGTLLRITPPPRSIYMKKRWLINYIVFNAVTALFLHLTAAITGWVVQNISINNCFVLFYTTIFWQNNNNTVEKTIKPI